MKLPTPRTVLLLDGMGGVVTALMLCVVLPAVHELVGLPRRTLIMLGLFGVVYGTYSLSCWKFVRTAWRRALAAIIAANAFYCVVTAFVVATHREAMSALGIAYFVAEILVIAALVTLEVAVLRSAALAA